MAGRRPVTAEDCGRRPSPRESPGSSTPPPGTRPPPSATRRIASGSLADRSRVVGCPRGPQSRSRWSSVVASWPTQAGRGRSGGCSFSIIWTGRWVSGTRITLETTNHVTSVGCSMGIDLGVSSPPRRRRGGSAACCDGAERVFDDLQRPVAASPRFAKSADMDENCEIEERYERGN